jgi:hypothetical protein
MTELLFRENKEVEKGIEMIKSSLKVLGMDLTDEQLEILILRFGRYLQLKNMNKKHEN